MEERLEDYEKRTQAFYNRMVDILAALQEEFDLNNVTIVGCLDTAKFQLQNQMKQDYEDNH